MDGFFYAQSEYSLLDNTIFLSDLVKQAKEYGYKFIALADNAMYGCYKFYKLCLENRIKPLIGLKVSIEASIKESYDLLLYAKNIYGYQNLLKISSYIRSKQEMIKLEEIKQYFGDIFAITPGKNGPVERFITMGNYIEARKMAEELKGIFEDFYMGLQLQVFNTDEEINEIVKCANDLNILLLPISKTSYLEKADSRIYEYIKSIDNKKAEIGTFHLKKIEELREEFISFPFVFDNIDEVVDKVDIKITKVKCTLPKYHTPSGISSLSYLKQLCMLGLTKRLNNNQQKIVEYQKRLNYELSVITKMGYEDYFLIVYDFVLYAKKQKYLVGPGRGSAAGSLVAYVLGITDVDPLKYGLLFERFLNPERITLPDIDMDFPDDKREDVIKYVHQKYGSSHVCHIATFGRFQARMAIRDIARVMHISEQKLNEAIKDIDSNLSVLENIEKPEVKRMMADSQISELLSVALKLEGLPRHISTHAAGMIISHDKITDITPLDRGMNGIYQSQYEACDLEELGLLKIDFLGLKNLTVIDKITKLLNNINIHRIPLNDEKTYKLLSEGDTNGVFQLESEGIRKVLRKLKPHDIEDVIACLALYRPGPMEQIDDYINRKNGQQYSFLHPDLKPILASTYGIIVYQEQIMRIASEFAGYTLGEADILRRAVSKKKQEVLIQERKTFVNKCLKKGYKEQEGNAIYDYIVKFANYGFNRNHSVPYALISYQMAYLKANYKKAFMCVLLSSVIGSEKQTKAYINECHKSGIVLDIPSVNESGLEFLFKDKIIFPLTSINKVGLVSARGIIEEREKGLYQNYDDFKKRSGQNKAVIEALIYAGALDCFNLTRKEMILNLDVDVEFTKYMTGIIRSKKEEYSNKELIAYEKQYLGVNIKYNLLMDYYDKMKKENILSIKEALEQPLLSRQKVIGYIVNKKIIKTKKGDEMCFLTISDGVFDNECVLFSKNYKLLKNNINYDIIFVFEILVQNRDQNVQFEILDIKGVR